MTFKDLQKLIQSQLGPEQSQLLQRLRDKPFWIWDPNQHKQEDIKTKVDCCFNHIIGLPTKERLEKPTSRLSRALLSRLYLGVSKYPKGSSNGLDKQEFILEPGEKGFAPTTHNQICPECNQEYWLDWIDTERIYL